MRTQLIFGLAVWTEEKTMYTNIFKDRLQDIYFQNVDSEVRNFSDNQLYKHTEHNFCGNEYFNTIKQNWLLFGRKRLVKTSHFTFDT